MSTPRPERHFLGWTESAAQSVARWLSERSEALAAMVDGVLDFSSVLVVVPGAGARRQVLAALRNAIKGAMIPPEMATPGKFVLSAFQTPAGACVAGPLDRLAALSRALAKEESLRSTLIPAARGTSLAALARPARRLLDVIDRADDAHWSVEAIARLDLLQASPTMREAWEQLAQLRVAMKGELSQMGRANGMELLERSDVIDLAARGWKPRCGALILAGLPDLARNVAFLSRELAGMQCNGAPVQVHALVLAPQSHESGFDDLGVVVESGFTSGPELADSMIEVAEDPADQAAAALARYSMLAGASDTGDTALVLADESMLPTMSRAFAEHGRTVHAGSGLRFSQTEIGKCLERLERAAQSGEPASFVELIRIAAITGAPEDNAIDLVQELDKLRERMKPGSTAALWTRFKFTSGEERKKVAEAIESKLSWCLADLSPEAGTTRPLGERWGQLVQWMPAMFAQSDSAVTARALEEFVKTMRRAQESAAAGEVGTAADALSLALMLCADISVPDSSDATSVDTVGWLETLFEPARKFVLAGVCEGSLPSSPQADGWFNEAIRQRIGLPSRATRFARDAYLLSALAARSGADQLAIIAGRSGSDGDPLKPSRLLLPKDPVANARRILLLTDPLAAPIRHRPVFQWKAGKRSAFAIPPVPQAKAPEVMNATDFSAYIKNPYRYWLEKILQLNAPEPDEMELNAADFGNLLHDAVQGLAEESVVSLDGDVADYEERCLAHLKKKLHEKAAHKYGSSLRPSIQLQVREIERRLAHLVNWHHQQIRLGWSVKVVEWATIVTIDVDGQEQKISMRVDRIDFHPDHGWRIIDYKSSDKGFDFKKKVFNGREWIDLQLPLYKGLVGQCAADEAALAGLAEAAADKIEAGVLSMPASNEPCAWCPLAAPVESGLEAAREVIRCIRAGKFADTGEDQGEKFARVRRALCLPTGESDASDESGEGAAE
ncbi:MAG: PD-(D/E)XK nuclease family protein [Planctomycetes bacterium]|nr:PD-(D/E)XK nuclease family protein [Planctomycetota bacterium]